MFLGGDTLPINIRLGKNQINLFNKHFTIPTFDYITTNQNIPFLILFLITNSKINSSRTEMP